MRLSFLLLFLFLPAHSKANELRFPASPFVIDVTKPPYEAKGDGLNDDTAALQQAINENTGRHRLHTTTAGKLAPMFVNDRSSVFTFFSEVCYNGDPFTVRIRETRDGETKTVGKDEGGTTPYSGRGR